MNYYSQNKKKISFSNILILISILCTLLTITYPDLIIFWMNKYFLNNGVYHIYMAQFFTYSFIHGWLFHLLSNSIFIYFFWNIVELILWKKKYIIFFLFSTVFIWIMLTFLSKWNTVWISGFAMALLTYFTLELKEKNNPEYKWWLTAIFINIIIWLDPSISLIWHFFWVIAWIIFYFLNKDLFRKAMIMVWKKYW